MNQLERVSPMVRAMEGIVNVIAGHNRPELRRVVENLKRSGGEAWAIGEMVERTCLMLDAFDVRYAGQEPPGPVEGEEDGSTGGDVQRDDSGSPAQAARDGGDGAGD